MEVGPFTYAETLCRRGKFYGNHYTILYNGITQPFGPIFHGDKGDIKRLVIQAVNKLNRAVAKGETSCTITGARRHYTVTIREDGIEIA